MNFVDDVLPWITAVGGGGLLASVVRLSGSGRMRANLEKDIELHKQLDGKAAEDLQAAIDWQAQALRQRVIEGYRPSPVGENLVASVLAFIFGLMLLVLAEYSLEGAWAAVTRVAALILTTGALVVFGGTISARMRIGKQPPRPIPPPLARRDDARPLADIEQTHTHGTGS